MMVGCVMDTEDTTYAHIIGRRNKDFFLYDLLAGVKSLIEINPKEYKLPMVDLLLFF